jgi:hypothetical protein
VAALLRPAATAALGRRRRAGGGAVGLLLGAALSKLADGRADLRVADALEIARQHQRLARLQRVLLLLATGRRGHLAALARLLAVLQPFEEDGDGHTEELAQLEQAAGGHAVEAALVLLQLLEGQPQRRGDVALAEPCEHAQFPQALADEHIDLVQAFLLFAPTPFHGFSPSILYWPALVPAADSSRRHPERLHWRRSLGTRRREDESAGHGDGMQLSYDRDLPMSTAAGPVTSFGQGGFRGNRPVGHRTALFSRIERYRPTHSRVRRAAPLTPGAGCGIVTQGCERSRCTAAAGLQHLRGTRHILPGARQKLPPINPLFIKTQQHAPT